jgi:tryptophanyl-tRNA synthetase
MTATGRTLSLLTPSGRLTLGNLLGALRPMAARQEHAFYGLSDLHALTTAHDPLLLRTRVAEMATLLLAAGLDRATLFRQSDVPAHSELAYLLECTAYTGELGRMIQFKEKGRGRSSTRVSLYTYPVLMAADILLYRPAVVPVGDDQRQHVELTRDLAIRFNTTYGEVFTVPEIATPAVGARVMDLADPTRKMSKSADAAGSIFLLDGPDQVRRKVSRAVTCGGSAAGITTYGALKAAVTDAVVAELEPLQRRYADLAADPAHVSSAYASGAARCREVTAPVLASARAAIGL